MRKGYGPTGVAFAYSYEDFKSDCSKGDIKAVELVIGKSAHMSKVDFSDKTDCELKNLYSEADRLEIRPYGRTIVMPTLKKSDTILLATNPTLDGIKQSIADYWFTDISKIDVIGGLVYQQDKLMENNKVLPHRDGFKFVAIRP